MKECNQASQYVKDEKHAELEDVFKFRGPPSEQVQHLQSEALAYMTDELIRCVDAVIEQLDNSDPLFKRVDALRVMFKNFANTSDIHKKKGIQKALAKALRNLKLHFVVIDKLCRTFVGEKIPDEKDGNAAKWLGSTRESVPLPQKLAVIVNL